MAFRPQDLNLNFIQYSDFLELKNFETPGSPQHRDNAEEVAQNKKLFTGRWQSIVNGVSLEADIMLKNVNIERNQEELERCQRLFQLSHASIVKLLGLCSFVNKDDEVSNYIVMERLSHTTLRSIVEARDSDTMMPKFVHVKAAEWFRWLVQMANGMDYLFRHQLFHGDLKPDNILVHGFAEDSTDLTRVSDAKIADLDSVFGRHYTSRWTAPERLLNNSAPTMKGDIYSYGTIVYTMLYRVPPFGSSLDEDLNHLIANKTIKLRVHETAPSECQCLVSNCLSFNPRGRPTMECIFRMLKSIRRHLLSISSDRWSELSVRLFTEGTKFSKEDFSTGTNVRKFKIEIADKDRIIAYYQQKYGQIPESEMRPSAPQTLPFSSTSQSSLDHTSFYGNQSERGFSESPTDVEARMRSMRLNSLEAARTIHP